MLDCGITVYHLCGEREWGIEDNAKGMIKEIDKLPARYIVFLYDSLWEYFKDNGICLWVSLPSCEKKVASFYFSKNEE